jgi:hypothetical protein
MKTFKQWLENRVDDMPQAPDPKDFLGDDWDPEKLHGKSGINYEDDPRYHAFSRSRDDWSGRVETLRHERGLSLYKIKSSIRPDQRIAVSKYEKLQVQPARIVQNPAAFDSGIKPAGGLWYSKGAEWIDFITDGYRDDGLHGFNLPGNYHMFVHEIEVADSVLKITKDNADGWRKNYGNTKEGWERLFKDYEGIEFFEFSAPTAWDLYSGVLWKQSGLKSSKLLYAYDGKTKQYEKAYNV